MARSLDSLERMPLWHGVPYNWYSLRDLTALPPRVVSSVDAGNCLLCLAAAAQTARTTGIQSDVPARRDAPYITLDGEKMTGAYVPLRDDGRAHEIRFPMPPANE